MQARLRNHDLFPLQLRTSRPKTGDLTHHFEKARRWIKTLDEDSKTKRGFGYEIKWTTVSHRQLGNNRIPDRIVIPSEYDALALIGKHRQASLISQLANLTYEALPQLKNWVIEHPMILLKYGKVWPRVLKVLLWFYKHPQEKIYLRQIDVPGVDTKFIERRRQLFAKLLDLILPTEVIDKTAVGANAFEQRYGLLAKPTLIRFRVLDKKLLPQFAGLSDIATPVADFAKLKINVNRVFITENDINGLCFPPMPESIVIFGLGYNVDHLTSIDWLKHKTIYYWGDIDTHGFAILDRLRKYFKDVHSLLMDRETLLQHRELWGIENNRCEHMLAHLTKDEQNLYNDLRYNKLANNIRFEQEHVGYAWLLQKL
ncbi:MAG: hypothetical protein JW841_11420 [Deltaproteobacteria bacterium]|nr:hypothetical protein [Deltaproteobacteria bacterium]